VATVDRWGRKTKLTARAHLIERREGGGQLGRREPKGKTYFHKYAIDTRASWAARLNLAHERRGASGAGWANGGVGRMVARAESEEKEFLN
jgi:hypothetical protein